MPTYGRRTSAADAFGSATGVPGREDGTVSDYYDLGTYSRAVTTGSRQAQRWFDRGLAWTYGYNHEEAIACYRRALDADPECEPDFLLGVFRRALPLSFREV